ncbi:LPS-assembly protein LptD [Verrucomicrobiota bacterium]
MGVGRWALIFLGFLVALPAVGQEKPVMRRPAAGPIDAQANKLIYDRNTGRLEAWGNVVIKVGEDELRADYMRGNTVTKMLYAVGNVILRQSGKEMRGRRLRYNMADRTGVWEGLEGDMDPFQIIEADKIERKYHGQQALYIAHGAQVTTCNKRDHHHYRVAARKAELVPDHHMKVRGAVWYFGPVPVLYVPFWYRILKEDFGFRFYPGHSSRMGLFLLSSVRYRINPLTTGESHFDVRSKRGIGLGQDLGWRTKGLGYLGDLTMYYVDDQEPVAEDEGPETTDIDNQRYRVRFKHVQYLGRRAYLLTELHYLSDEDIREDFFEDEYRERSQVDNYVTYTYRGDSYTASLMGRARLNDFYTTVTRLPEASVSVLKLQIGDSFVYYEGETVASALEKEWEEESDEENYSAFRFDTLHMLSRPSKCLGFLNLTPRVGWRGTYYSDTHTTITETQTTMVTNALGFGTSTVTTVTRDVAAGADFRSSPEVGLETSFKAFKTWGGQIRPRRHVIEPYANYTLRPEPSLLPEDLYQFDDVDQLGEDHSVRVGVRNKLQTKRNGAPWDLVDLDVNTRWDMEPEEGEESADSVNFDAEFRPSKSFKVDLDGTYDLQDSLLDRFNAQVNVGERDMWAVVMEYRIREDRDDLVFGDLTLPAGRSWTYNVYGRYRIDDGRWEEQGGYIQRNLDCMKIRTGASVMPGYIRSDGTERDDEWRVTLEMWLTAFPKVGFSGKHRN